MLDEITPSIDVTALNGSQRSAQPAVLVASTVDQGKVSPIVSPAYRGLDRDTHIHRHEGSQLPERGHA